MVLGASLVPHGAALLPAEMASGRRHLFWSPVPVHDELLVVARKAVPAVLLRARAVHQHGPLIHKCALALQIWADPGHG